MNTRHLLRFIVLLVLIGSTSSAFAGWSVTYLNPTDCTYSVAYGVADGRPVGAAILSGYMHALLWTNSGSFRDLGIATARATSGSRQVGNANGHAALWRSSASSLVDLNPVAGYSSEATGVYGSEQVGCAYIGTGGRSHAGIWYGSASSWVDLHPVGFTYSYGVGTFNGRQVGWALGGATGPNDHAGIWSGTAASWMDLHPAGYLKSQCRGIWGTQQTGVAYPDVNSCHAGVWYGTSASWTSLHPSGYTSSSAYGVSNGWQVGHAMTGGKGHAGVWNGTAASWVDLHSLLGPGFTSSSARGVDVVGDDIWVAGQAIDSAGNYQAIMWHGVVPEPSSLLALGSGLLALGGLIRRKR